MCDFLVPKCPDTFQLYATNGEVKYVAVKHPNTASNLLTLIE